MGRPGGDSPAERVDESSDVRYEVATDGTLRCWNDRLEELTGYTSEQLADGSIVDLVPDGERAAVERHVDRAATTSSDRIETAIVAADGRQVPYELISQSATTPHAGETRHATVCLGVGRNADTEEDRERDPMGQSAAMEASIDGLAVLNEDESYQFVNESHARIYGYDSPSELYGNTWRVCYGEEELARFEEEVMPELFETGSWLGEAVGVRKDGSEFPQELSLSLTADDRVVCVVRDITERKRSERRLRQQNDRLEKFSRLLAHDLRNPLTVAGGHLELLADGVDDRHRTHFEKTEQALGRIETIVEDALELATAGRPVDPDRRERVELGTVATDAWNSVRTREAALHVEGREPFGVEADASRLQQILENLFRNAVEHGRSDATVWVGPLGGSDGFYVEDDGPGIPEADRNQVFDMGFTTSDDGTGYGMTSVKQLASAHGWDVSVVDGRAGGARFEIDGVRSTSAADAE